MALSRKELDQLVEHHTRHDPFRTWRQRDDELHFRSLYVKHDPQLAALTSMYERKIKVIVERYDRIRQGLEHPGIYGTPVEEELLNWEAKICRLAEKLRDTRFEIRGRVLGNLERDPIGTEYFIDLDGGNNGNTGLSPAQAWLTLEQYTTTTARSPGDIAWVRAATSEVIAANIACDEDGTKSQPIYIIGCSSGSGSGSDEEDPWGDDEDTRPIVDANGSASRFEMVGDHFWTVENMDFKSTLGSGYPCFNLSAYGAVLRNCRFYDSKHATSGAYGLMVASDHISPITIEDCEFYSNRLYGVHHTGGIIYRRCKFDGDIGGLTYTQTYGIHVSSGTAWLVDCEFGQTSPHGSGDIYGSPSCMAYLKNCALNKTSSEARTSIFWEETTFDDYPTRGLRGNLQHYLGVVEESDETPVSGVNYSLMIVPNVNAQYAVYGCQLVDFQTPMAWPGPMRIWLPAGDYSVVIPVRAILSYTNYPTAAELYIIARFNDAASANSLGEAVSSDVLSDASTWVDFEVTFSHAKDGFVYLDLSFTKYQSGGRGIYLYPFPEVTAI